MDKSRVAVSLLLQSDKIYSPPSQQLLLSGSQKRIDRKGTGNEDDDVQLHLTCLMNSRQVEE